MPTNGLFNECIICLDIMVFKRRKLGCGHVFHRRCIDSALRLKNECPICSSLVFDDYETRLLNGKATFAADSLPSERAIMVLREAIRRGKTPDLVKRVVARHDPSRLAHEYITEKDAKSLSSVISARTLNWHSTSNDKTVVDAALGSQNENIINVVMEAATAKKQQRLYPIIT